jgi:hypothetical protein
VAGVPEDCQKSHRTGLRSAPRRRACQRLLPAGRWCNGECREGLVRWPPWVHTAEAGGSKPPAPTYAPSYAAYEGADLLVAALLWVLPGCAVGGAATGTAARRSAHTHWSATCGGWCLGSNPARSRGLGAGERGSATRIDSGCQIAPVVGEGAACVRAGRPLSALWGPPPHRDGVARCGREFRPGVTSVVPVCEFTGS